MWKLAAGLRALPHSERASGRRAGRKAKHAAEGLLSAFDLAHSTAGDLGFGSTLTYYVDLTLNRAGSTADAGLTDTPYANTDASEKRAEVPADDREAASGHRQRVCGALLTRV